MSLQIKLVNAILSHDTEFFSNMDPYCVLKLGPQTFRSRTKNQAGKRPVWNETFTFSAYDNVLKITVMDQDTVTDDLVGEGTIDISKYRNSQTQQQQMVQLYYHGKNAGKVQITLRSEGGNNSYGQQNGIPNNLIVGLAQGNNSWQQNTGWGGQTNTNWGGQNNGWGGQGMQPAPMGGNSFNPYAPQPNPSYVPNQPMMPVIPPQPPQPPQPQWGNVNNNNGWGDFNPSPQFNKNTNNNNNLYPSLDNPNTNNNNNFNPLNLMGQFIGQQAKTQPQTPPPYQPNIPPPNQPYQNNIPLQNNVPLQYQLINGMGILNKGNTNYGTNPYQ